MFSKITLLRKISPSFAAYIAALLLLIGVGAFFHIENYITAQQPKFDAASMVEHMGKGDKTVFEEIRDSLSDIIKQGGIQGALDVDGYALAHNKLGIYQCHVLSHLIGHESIVYYGNNFNEVISQDSHFCELGYRHGAEAQIVFEGGDYQHQLYTFCDDLKKKNPSAECFHGAGHAFMNQTLDVQTSLTLCDGLIDKNHTVDDVTPCYNAVFAELTNFVGGRDGETAMPYSQGPILTIKETSPLQYCSKFDERYRLQCVFEFSGLGIGPDSTKEDVETKLSGCTLKGYDEQLEAACIRSVSAVGAQHLLANEQTLEVPKLIFDLSDTLRQAYIQGSGTEMEQYLVSGATRDWQSFCNSFKNDSDTKLCSDIFATPTQAL